MNSTTLSTALETVQEEVLPGEIDPQSLYRTLETVQDGRAKRGVRYSVALVLTLIIIGKLVGMKTPEAIGQWVTERTE